MPLDLSVAFFGLNREEGLFWSLCGSEGASEASATALRKN